MKKTGPYLLVFSFIIVLCSFALILWNSTKETWNIGLGDFFDPLNTLFSGLAFGGLTIALVIQRKELGLQRDALKAQLDELKMQREVQEQSNEEFRLQNATMTGQRFESTFFQMINLHNQIVSGLNYSTVNPGISGAKFYYNSREVFRPLLDSLHLEIFSRKGRYPHEDEIWLSSSFSKFYTQDRTEEILEHYFSNLFMLFTFVHESKDIEYSKRRFYTSLIICQLSKNEKILLLYFALGYGPNKFLGIIRAYNVMGVLNDYDTELLPEWVQNIYTEKTKNFKPDIR